MFIAKPLNSPINYLKFDVQEHLFIFAISYYREQAFKAKLDLKIMIHAIIFTLTLPINSHAQRQTNK